MAMITGNNSAVPSTAASRTDGVRVMLVDDSAVIRGLLSRALKEDPRIEIVASVGNGIVALKTLERYTVDVIVLDIEMPEMDGLTALPQLLKASPKTKVIMASTLTKKNADVTLRAMRMGAADCIPKPTSTKEMTGTADFNRELLSKVLALGGQDINRKPVVKGTATTGVTAPAVTASKLTLRSATLRTPPRCIAVGSSTGGPQALFNVLAHLKGVKQPVFITQHMPPTFTTILAEHIEKQCGLICKEAVDGETVTGGRVYLAPGDYHMTIQTVNAQPIIKLNQNPPVNFCRPAVDPMMDSLVKVYSGSILAVILTGMGADGRDGCRGVVDAGGQVMAQDEASSVVWGMPGAVAEAGLCSDVLPLDQIGRKMRQIAG